MTEEQFEALKAWIYAMRDLERAMADVNRSPWLINLGQREKAAEILALTEKQARAELVEDKS